MNIKHIKIFIYIIFFLSISFIFSFSDTTGVVNENKQSVISVLSPEDSSKALEALRHEIEGILSNKAIQSSRFGLSIYSLDSKKYIYNKNIDNLLTPASTTKLFTSFTALTAFGADFEIKTNVVTDGQISKDGELKGNIFIIGHGDPMLSVADIENLADQISSLGIKKITGNIYGDASYFDGISSRRIYSGDRDEVQATPPVTALCIENNIATTLVTSGSKDGESVKVQIIPESDAFAKQINAKVRGVSTRKNFKKSKKGQKALPPQQLKKKARKKISLKDVIEINDFTEIINKSAEQKSEIIDYGWGGAAMRKKARMTRP
ncbi:MAG: hypothetical protein QG635_965, partial [Bacteroidota bacterium]|nr:hypothetical protein [Bacteroidota bacterium]